MNKEQYMKLDGLTMDLKGEHGDTYVIDGMEYIVPTTFVVEVEDSEKNDVLLTISALNDVVFSERFTTGEGSLARISECLIERGYEDINTEIVEAATNGICFKPIISESFHGEYNGEYNETTYFDFKGALLDSKILEQDGNSLWKSRKGIELYYLQEGTFVTTLFDFYQEDCYSYYKQTLKRELIQDDIHYPNGIRTLLLQKNKGNGIKRYHTIDEIKKLYDEINTTPSTVSPNFLSERYSNWPLLAIQSGDDEIKISFYGEEGEPGFTEIRACIEEDKWKVSSIIPDIEFGAEYFATSAYHYFQGTELDDDWDVDELRLELANAIAQNGFPYDVHVYMRDGMLCVSAVSSKGSSTVEFNIVDGKLLSDGQIYTDNELFYL